MSKRNLIDSIEVKSPCSEDWDKMTGNDKVRFCDHCAFEVNNISTLKRKQAMKLVRESDGRICVRYVKNPVNNKPLFAEKLYQITRRAGIAAGVLGASLSLSTLVYAQGKPTLTTSDPQEVSQKENTEKDKTENPTASISGTVTDSVGAIIPNAKITLTNLANNENLISATNEDGFYKFESVAVGNYRMQAASAGFGDNSFGINVTEVSENIINFTLEPRIEMVTMGMMMLTSYSDPIFQAVSNNDLEEVKNLISRGTNVNLKDNNFSRITPLFLAVENGNVEITETLLSFGAKVNAKDDSKQTPLMRLDDDATPELVRVLLKYGAKANLVDKEGNNALILASSSVKTEVLQILIDNTANINAQNKEGRTALMEAAENDNLENVRALLISGADANLKDKDGETALSLTTNEEIESLLGSYGAIVEEN